MKLFVILSRVPYPLDKGDKLRAYHQLAELSKRHDIILCCLSDSTPSENDLHKARMVCKELHIFKLQRWRIALNLAFSFFSRKPWQVVYFYQSHVHSSIQALIEQHRPDHIYCQLIRTAEYAKNEHNYIKTLDYQDAFSKGMDRRSESSGWPLKGIFNSERRRLVAYENIIFEYFEAKTIISDEDRRYIYHPERKDIEIVTNGIDTDFFRSGVSKSRPQYDLVFTGNMGYAPNVETAEYIVNEVLPILRKHKPDATVLLAGSSPSRRVKALAAANGVSVSGWLEDIRTAYESGKVFFAPMQLGTGLQNKLLEAMAMQLPCVTSSLANKPLKAKAMEHIMVADNAEDYAARIMELLNDPSLSQSMGEAGRIFVEKNFSWKASVSILENAMITENQKAQAGLLRQASSAL